MIKKRTKIFLLIMFSTFLIFYTSYSLWNPNLLAKIDTSSSLTTSGSATICYGDWCLISSESDEDVNVTWSFSSFNHNVRITVLFMTWSEYLKFENSNPYTVTTVLANGSKYADSGVHLKPGGINWAYVFMHNDSTAMFECTTLNYGIDLGPAIPSFDILPVILTIGVTILLFQLLQNKEHIFKRS